MLCSRCGHYNPIEHRFCGMCGASLVAAPASQARDNAQEELASARNLADRSSAKSKAGNVREVWSAAPTEDVEQRTREAAEARPMTPERRLTPPAPERRASSPTKPMHRADADSAGRWEGDRDYDVASRRDETPRSSDTIGEQFREPSFTFGGYAPEPPAAERKSVRASEEPSERSTEIHGPSFLGLSGSDSSSTDYLLEDEEGSHAGRIAFLLVLLAAVAVGAWKFDAIKSYVWTQAVKHSQPAQPATDQTKAPDQSASTEQNPMPQNDANGKPEMAVQPAQQPSSNEATTAKPAENAKPNSPTEAQPETKPDENAPAPAAKAGTSKPQESAKAEAPAKPEQGADEAATADEEPAKPAPTSHKAAAAPAPAPAPKMDRGAELLTAGEKYLYGRGVPQSCRQALVYFKAAADQDNPGAMSHVAAMYATGQCGVQINRVQAYRWFSRAYELQPRNQYLERNLTMLWREMSTDERNSATHATSGRGQ